MKKLKVIYQGWGENWPLGILADNDQQLLFEYSSEALKEGLELSPVNLKLQKEAFGNFPAFQMRLPGLISDSLPDGWGLLLMDKIFRKKGTSLSQVSPLDRLSFLGSRAMGAFVYEPHTDEELTSQELKLLEIAKEVQKIIHGQASEALPELALMGGSPQGARPKVLVNYDPKKKIISSDVAIGDPWIIKFQAEGEHKEICALEQVYAELAKKSGLVMAETQYFDLGKGLSAFGSRRFDREKGMKIPIHTLSGVLNADFRIPSSSDYLSLLKLTRLMTHSEAEVVRAFQQCVFNVVFNNRDDHSKNFSFRLEKNRRWKLSPAYDLTFNRGPGGEHQMDIMGEGRNPGREHLLALAKEAGIDKKKCEQIIERVLEVSLQFKKQASKMPIRKHTISEIHKSLSKNAQAIRF